MKTFYSFTKSWVVDKMVHALPSERKMSNIQGASFKYRPCGLEYLRGYCRTIISRSLDRVQRSTYSAD